MPAASKQFSQEELLLSIRKGNTAAFSILYDTYSPVIFAVINKSVADIKVSEDLLQRTFIKIWQNISNFDPSKQRFLAWMLVIARSMTNETIQGQNLNKNSEIQTSANNVSKNIEALTLIYFKGYSLKKAAEILQVTETELKIKLKREIDQVRAPKIK
jgi:RNA polymerase sigma-70 factor (ECF subfamily)